MENYRSFSLLKSISEKKFKFHGSLDIPQHLFPKNPRYLQINFAELEQDFMIRLYHQPYCLNIYGLKAYQNWN